ncbi:hypothetical protein G7007_13760 [Pseudomonas entomophila]|jgi:type IV pilus assembly protein PilX|uniref:hypothetical protein n=1 Tax=Pseudomonas entomophila TaxID=312306 RepID=UPI0015E444F7|nr:hypothetical protein [Pseudomonas entomophila]MBA1193910.1 hypothetical protein [Pseudomonas entomophila]
MNRQRGVVLLAGLALTLLLGMVSAAALREALLDTRQAGDLLMQVRAFEQAEAALLAGVDTLHLAPPAPCLDCPPPAWPAFSSGAPKGWVRTPEGFYQVQTLGPTTLAAQVPEGTLATLFRITAVNRHDAVRQVIEALYAVPMQAPQTAVRVLWRQRFEE